MNIRDLLGEEWAAALPKAEELLEPIRQQLHDERACGMTILPQGQTFRVFKETPPSKIRVIWLGQD